MLKEPVLHGWCQLDMRPQAVLPDPEMSETTITLDSRDEAVLLFGSRDQYLREVRAQLGMQQLVGRGNQILLKGSDEQVEAAKRVFDQLRRLLKQQGSLSSEDVKTVLEVVTQGGEAIGLPSEKPAETGSRYVRPRTDGQARYVRAMRENDLTVCVGPAGTGKCVSAETLVLTDEGLIPIEELAGDTKAMAYQERPTLVFSMNGPTRASHVYNGGQSHTFRIQTRHGLELEGTPEHPVLVLGVDGFPQWRTLASVQVGDFVAVARGTNLFGKQVAVNFRYERSLGDQTSHPVQLDRIDEEIAYFLGLMVGDGCMRGRNRVIFTSADIFLREAFERVLRRWGLRWSCNPGRPYDMVVYSRQLHHLLLHLGVTGCLAHQKQMPACILRAPRPMVVAFLQGLFDTDGCADRRDGYVSLASSSIQLIHQVQLMLLNLGIVTQLRSKPTSRRTAFTLEIRGEETAHFMDRVGFRLPRKAERIKILRWNTNLDVVPHAGVLLDSVVRQHTLSRKVHKQFGDYRNGRRSPSYTKLAALMLHFHEAHPNRDCLEWLVERHYLWSEITHIEAGYAQVYDLTVPGEHSFVAGGIINHNTWLAVGMAVSLLRQGIVKKIVLVRPAVEAGERLGFLPGDIVAKVNPFLRPLFDALNDMMEPEQVKRYMENDIIEIVPLAYMRGRTLNQAVIILDEGQNTTVPQMKMFLTRMGNGSKIIVTGDVTQVDLPKQTRSGLTDAVHRLRDIERIAVIYLDEHDIVRNPLVQQILRAYEEERPRKKKE